MNGNSSSRAEVYKDYCCSFLHQKGQKVRIMTFDRLSEENLGAVTIGVCWGSINPSDGINWISFCAK